MALRTCSTLLSLLLWPPTTQILGRSVRQINRQQERYLASYWPPQWQYWVLLSLKNIVCWEERRAEDNKSWGTRKIPWQRLFKMEDALSVHLLAEFEKLCNPTNLKYCRSRSFMRSHKSYTGCIMYVIVYVHTDGTIYRVGDSGTECSQIVVVYPFSYLVPWCKKNTRCKIIFVPSPRTPWTSLCAPATKLNSQTTIASSLMQLRSCEIIVQSSPSCNKSTSVNSAHGNVTMFSYIQ